MRKGLIILNVVLLLAVGVLFYLHFSSKTNQPSVVKNSKSPGSNVTASGDFKIAYFEMDSLQNSFAMVKDVKAELQKKEAAINNQLAQMEKTYRDRAAQYQGQAATMTQQQSEVATRDMMQLQQSMQGKKQQLDQEYQDFYVRKMQDVKNKIEEFMKEYNKNKGYSYIITNEPGFIYYRDTIYNITGDVVKGLNEAYKKKK